MTIRDMTLQAGTPQPGGDAPDTLVPAMPVQTSLSRGPGVGTVDAAREGGLLTRIAAGEQVAAEVHESLVGKTPHVQVADLNLFYGDKQALYDVKLPVPTGEITALIGPSGCGKPTLLRCVNRLNDLVDSCRVDGAIYLDDEDIYAPGQDVIELRKRVGMVFQKPNPFPMTIFENVVYPLRIDGERNKTVLEEACQKSLEGAGLWKEVKDRLQDSALQLSGGQQQRLCIARAISAEPEVLLLDEPCSALDPIATGRIEDLLAELRGRYTILMVTHNMQQASRTSDYTAFMYLGNLIEFGPTADIFLNPHLRETEDYVTGRFG